MTFDAAAHCAPAALLDISADGLFAAGQPGALCVLWVGGEATATATANGTSHPLPAGHIVAAQGEIELVLPAACRVAGAVLQGAAAQALAAALPEIWAADSAACPTLADNLLLLAAGGADPLRASALAYALLCGIAAADAARPAPLPPLVTAALAALQEHYAEVYGVEELAAQLEVSKCHLVRVFSAAMGTPPGQYLTQLRITAAKQLLLRDEYTLDIVAGLAGFSGANYFCKVFKKATGQTPAAWRRAVLPSRAPAPMLEQEALLYL